MSLEDRLQWITAIVTTVTTFANEVEEAVLGVAIDCGKFELITIKQKEEDGDAAAAKKRIYIHFYDDYIMVEGKSYTYDQKDVFITRLTNYLRSRYISYF